MCAYKQSCTNLMDLPTAKVTEWLEGFDTVITDCDGVLWVYGRAIDGAVSVINLFKSMRKNIYFCTNNSTKTREELLKKAQNMGFSITEGEIISTAHATAAYLKKRNFEKRVYVIGSDGITKELDAVGIGHTGCGPDPMKGTMAETTKIQLETDIGAVVVGFDEHFSFPKMVKASSYLNDPNCLFIATNTDERFPMDNMVVPGSGCFVRAIETCAERTAKVIGKPNPAICEVLLQKEIGRIDPARTLMIGDRANTDILLGFNCGFQTLLVGTGVHQLSDVERWKKSKDLEDKKLIPDMYLPKLGDLLPALPLPKH
ncbi:GL22743 [Drosophila persimilis]|uniref:Glycerol-3-phosphate phosphatase n=2 Tax=pseudoobscura subgroup TaxID=32358 RepID=A0A6I8UDX6_DROPS|nr:glycerol-3-phosphate phosphatase [Drosophila pseudoobscura]XP_002024093.1 glycerol-3-phosphate phosphatase [Drosophila persimilis]XP_033239127.1 glycerol-3-phosphate phosphatase [Drosophila pseudoobscura]EDW29491.1 GL22743 [Drosophila persimilis]